MTAINNTAPHSKGVTVDTAKASAQDYSKPISTDAAHQRAAVEKRLKRKGSATALFFRESMGIMSIAARIYELMHGPKALNTQLTRMRDSDASGIAHKQGPYSLHPGKWKEAEDA